MKLKRAIIHDHPISEHLRESPQEARVALGYASSNRLTPLKCSTKFRLAPIHNAIDRRTLNINQFLIREKNKFGEHFELKEQKTILVPLVNGKIAYKIPDKSFWFHIIDQLQGSLR